MTGLLDALPDVARERLVRTPQPEWTEPMLATLTDDRVGFGALLIGYYEQDRLRYAGKVGTGYDRQTLERPGRRLAGLERAEPAFADGNLPRAGVHWVEPRLVGQIGFIEWTRDGQLRHPRFQGLRRDKPPRQIRRERAL